MSKNIEGRLQKIMSNVFEIDIKKVEGGTPETIENWDSLKHMNLILALEEEFEEEFNDDEIVELMSYESLLKRLK